MGTLMKSIHCVISMEQMVTLLSTDSDIGGFANTLSYPSLSFEESAFNVCVWDQIGAPVFTLGS